MAEYSPVVLKRSERGQCSIVVSSPARFGSGGYAPLTAREVEEGYVVALTAHCVLCVFFSFHIYRRRRRATVASLRGPPGVTTVTVCDSQVRLPYLT